MTGRPPLPAAVPFDLVGTVAVVDLESACALYGRDMLPYPLGRTRPVGSVWLATRVVHPIGDRMNNDDLHGVRAWIEALVQPDVCLECHVRYVDGNRPDLRMHGLRAGEFGFVARQATDGDGVDTVDIYAVPPEKLGAAITETVGLLGAGVHPRIEVIDGDRCADLAETLDEPDDLSFLAADTCLGGQDVSVVDRRDVSATGTVQSRTGPARHWGVDPERRILHWLQVGGDGDYSYEPGSAEYAEPFDAAMLRSWLDGFIADDMEATREQRDLR